MSRESQGAGRAQLPETPSALMGAEGMRVFMRAAPSLRNQTQCSYFYANSLANERQLSIPTPSRKSQKPTGSAVQSILVIYLKERETQEINSALKLPFFTL